MFYLTDNPFKGKVPDDKVQRYWDMFRTKSSMKAEAAGFLDFFVYKICEDYLFDQDMEIQCVEGDGNCLPTSVIKTLDFDKDPGSDQMYTQILSTQSGCNAFNFHVENFWVWISLRTSNILMAAQIQKSEVSRLRNSLVKGRTERKVMDFR